MLTKYGTYVVYKCDKCQHTTEIPLHLEDNPPLEKYASYCTHEWIKLGEEDYGKTDREEDKDLQPSEAGTESSL